MQRFVVCTKRRLHIEPLPCSINDSLWLKKYDPALKKEAPKLTVLNEDNKKVCPGRQK